VKFGGRKVVTYDKINEQDIEPGFMDTQIEAETESRNLIFPISDMAAAHVEKLKKNPNDDRKRKLTCASSLIKPGFFD